MLIEIFRIFHDIVSLFLRNECACRMGRTINFRLDDGRCPLFWVLLRPPKYQNLSNWSSTYIIQIQYTVMVPVSSKLRFMRVSFFRNSFAGQLPLFFDRHRHLGKQVTTFHNKTNTIKDGGGTVPIKRLHWFHCLHCLGVVHLLRKLYLGSRETSPPHAIL